MIYFKDELDNVHAIEEENQQLLLDKGYTLITKADANNLLAPTSEEMKNIQFQNLKKDLNVRLKNNVYNFEDGSKIRIRPEDDMNIRNAIEIMEFDNINHINWLTVDNKKKQVTVADLKAALVTRQKAFLKSWNTYVNAVEDKTIPDAENGTPVEDKTIPDAENGTPVEDETISDAENETPL